MKIFVMACCAEKADLPMKAIDLYISRAYNLVRGFRSDLEANGWQIQILSAKYGLVDADDELDPYDQKMTPELADHHAESSPYGIFSKGDQVVVFGGALYRDTVKQIYRDADVTELVGFNRGCGDHYSALKAFVLQESSQAVVGVSQ